jgi:Ig domain of plant-specific actin-binding protein
MATAVALLLVPASAAADPPTNDEPPTISGTAQQGATLTASEGQWSGTPAPTFSYQWQRCNESGGSCDDISGAEQSTYTVAAADVGSRLRVQVTATNADGSASENSSTTAVVVPAAPVNVNRPAISGTPRQGRTLTASQGTWKNNPTAFFYQWLRCDAESDACQPISGAVQPTYVLGAADVGSRIRVRVVATNAGGASPAVRSARTGVVRVPVPTNTARPTLAGTPREGNTLTASPGTWGGFPTSFMYSWRRCDRAGRSCDAIAGASDQNYQLGAADIGSTIRISVRAINAGGPSSPVSSAATENIKPILFKLGKLKRNRQRGTAKLKVNLGAPGTVSLRRTAKVKGANRDLDTARAVKLKIKPRGGVKRRLRRNGKAKVRLFVTYDSELSGPRTKQRRVTLKRR